MYEIRLTDAYRKKALKFFKKHPELKERYKQVMRLLQVNPFVDALEIKKMAGHKNLYRLRITLRARMVMEIIIADKIVTPVDIDTRENIF
jgi:mRNA-degrading endonuclease RelE of RelBE toxin-antitoxin system